MRKNFVIQKPWNLCGIYNMVYSLVLANTIDSSRVYFEYWVSKVGYLGDIIEVEYIILFYQES